MKKQMKFSKILALVCLIVAALCFISSLALSTGLSNINVIYALSVRKHVDIQNADIYVYIQEFNKVLMSFGLISIIVSLLNFMTLNNSRRRYYISNYVSSGLTTIGFIVLGVVAILNVLQWRIYFQSIDWATLEEFYQANIDRFPFEYSKSPFFFDLSIVMNLLLVVCGVLVTVNLIWKIRLMKFEDKLIKGEVKIDEE